MSSYPAQGLDVTALQLHCINCPTGSLCAENTLISSYERNEYLILFFIF